MDNEPTAQESIKIQSHNNNKKSCGSNILFFFAVVWIIICTFVVQLTGWFVEQMIFEGSLGMPSLQWMIILIYSLLIVIPFSGLTIFIHQKHDYLAYRTFLLAGIIALCLVPGRFLKITESQSLAIMQLLLMSISLIIVMVFVWFWNGRKKLKILPHTQGLAIALVISAIMAFPWIFWGALGSLTDVILNLLVGLMFGVLVSVTLSGGLFSTSGDNKNNYEYKNYFINGLISALALMIMVTGLGQNGNQWMLLVTIPIFGWGCGFLNNLFIEWKEENGYSPFPYSIATAILVGLTTSWALLFFDPDELMIVMGLGNGEILQWAASSAFTSMVLGAVIGVIITIFRGVIKNNKLISKICPILAILLWISLGILYIVRGRGGFYGEKLFVILKDQLDLTSLSSVTDYDKRRTEVYKTLTNHAEKTQADLIESLKRFHIPYQQYYLVNGLEVQGGPLIKLWLSTMPEVDRILASPHLRPLPATLPDGIGEEKISPEDDWNLSMINADRVWKELGITGLGIVIGQSDSGVQGNHQELADSYRGKENGDDYNWFDPWNHSRIPVDIGGHGTHTLGIILGNQVGVAPDAQWIGCVNSARNFGNIAYYLDCWQFLFAPFPQDGNPLKDGHATLGANILNNSWSCPDTEGCDPEVLLPAAVALRAAGVFVVVSAGNSGYSGCASVDDPPAIYDEVYTVGAVDINGVLTDFTSLGPVEVDGSSRIKPDIVAPGAEIFSSFPGNSYKLSSGTSMAGPHVTGVVALMWSANHKLIGNIEMTEQILNNTAKPYQNAYQNCIMDSNRVPNNGVGFGIVDAYSAVKNALDYEK